MVKSFGAAALTACVLVCGLVDPALAAEVQTQSGPVNVESLAKLDNPWGMAFLPDGKLLITEKPGRLRIYADGKLSEPISGVPKVAYRQQGGLLDVEIDPDFANNKLVYLSYAEPAEQQPPDTKDTIDQRLGTFFRGDDPMIKNAAVARARLDGNALKDLKVIWRQEPHIGRGHFGGRLIFAPDGKLFILSGERQRSEPAQDPKSALGAVVRINPDGSVPQDNPFVGKDGYRTDLYTKGNRNPLGGAIHPASKKLWINEMGPKGGDELNVIEPGKNYGWPLVAVNATHYNDAPIPQHSSRPEFSAPLKAWTPVISPSGMIFYNGSRFPSWKGNAFIGGLSSRALIRLTISGATVADEERINMGFRVRDVEEAPDGAVLLLSDGNNGELLRLTPAGTAAK